MNCNKKMLRFIVAGFLVLSSGLGCGGGSTTTTGGATISGTVSVPSTEATSASLSGLKLKSAVTDVAGCEGCTATCYDLAGTEKGTDTVEEDGTFSVAPSGLAEGEQALFLEISNTDDTIAIRCFAQVTVTAGETVTDAVTCNTDSTLAVAQMIQSLGCSFGGDCSTSASGVDLLCDFKSKVALWALADQDGEGLTDEMAAMKAAVQGCMGGGCAGVTDMSAFMDQAMAGTVTIADYSAEIAAQTNFPAADLESKWTNAASAAQQMGDYFVGIAGSTDAGIAALTLKGVAKATSGTACDSMKTDSNYAASIAATIVAADDVATFTSSFVTKTGAATTIFNMMEKYKVADGTYTLTGYDGTAWFGQMSECSGTDYTTCIDDTKMDTMYTLYTANAGDFEDMTFEQKKNWGSAVGSAGTIACTDAASCGTVAGLFNSQILVSDYDPTAINWEDTLNAVNPNDISPTCLDEADALATPEAVALAKQACYGNVVTLQDDFEAPTLSVCSGGSADGTCQTAKGETVSNCPADCPVVADFRGTWTATQSGMDTPCPSGPADVTKTAGTYRGSFPGTAPSTDPSMAFTVSGTTCSASMNNSTVGSCTSCTISSGTGGSGTVIVVSGCTGEGVAVTCSDIVTITKT